MKKRGIVKGDALESGSQKDGKPWMDSKDRETSQAGDQRDMEDANGQADDDEAAMKLEDGKFEQDEKEALEAVAARMAELHRQSEVARQDKERYEAALSQSQKERKVNDDYTDMVIRSTFAAQVDNQKPETTMDFNEQLELAIQTKVKSRLTRNEDQVLMDEQAFNN